MFDFIKNALNAFAGPMATVVDLAGDALGLPPVLTNSIKAATGVMTGNVMMAASGMAGVASELMQNPSAQTEYCPSPEVGRASAGYASPPSTASAAPRGGTMDPMSVTYRDALKTLAANFSLFDTLQGKKGDGKFNLQTLQEAATHPSLSPELREAARFFLQHPEYRHVLDIANKGGNPDGTFSQQDVQKALKKVNDDIAAYGVIAPPVASPGCPPPVSRPPPAGQPGGPGSCAPPPVPLPTPLPSPGCGGSSGNVRDILNNPNMSMEEKLQAILMMITRDTDDELLGVMSEMASLREERATLGSGDAGRAAKLDTSMEQLNLRLQKLMEKRKQMFDLMSNISSNFNEMAKTAIQNLGRA
ncbi:hypothetical protein [Stigmatella erecta]|uniref:Uncharacterized protein n=1 Tax=Stigmatella erecta TaxID=83460 RepID=A0A1I0DJH9_9BACT|nr:hypothetical protein [Stigmatella erecta]SET32498.1 hypothetical protein SAMN05443639_102561 [Stigmatella erecta]